LLSQIDHVGIAVSDLERAVREYTASFGIEPMHRERVESQGVDEVLFSVGESFIQLLGALGPDTPVGRFLATRGEGVHHIAYRVDDIERSLAMLRDGGVRLIDPMPRPGSRGTRIAFVHPRATRGVLVELVQEPAGP
jgi:methylmalonyl-CoA/ethylmalonyl-CoA epimerase